MVAKSPDKELERLPPCAIDFLKLVIKKVRYRKKVQAEVMAELAAHFEDELKDCKSNEEKEQRAEKLIADFGNVKLLGVLLRRAKKRCRPLWRTMVARTFQTAGILILCLIVYIGWFLMGEPVISVDYLAQLNQMVRPAANESLNAAPLYNQAAELYGKVSDDFLIFFAENHEAISDLESRRVLPRVFRGGGTLIRRPSRRTAAEVANEIVSLLADRKTADFNKEKREEIEGEVAGGLVELIAKRYDETSVGEKRFIKRWMEDQREALDLVVAGARKPYSWRKYEAAQERSEISAILLPHLAKFRDLAHALYWRAHLRAEQGRYDDAFGDLKSCYRLGQHIKGDNTLLIEQLVGIAIEALATLRLREVLSEYEIDSIALTNLQKDFEQMVAKEDFTMSFEAAKLSMYDAIQRCFTQDRLGGGHISLRELRRLEDLGRLGVGDFSIFEKFWPQLPYILFTHPNKQETKQMTDRYFAFLEEAARKTPARLRAEEIDFEEQAQDIVNGNILLEIIMPAYDRMVEICHRTRPEAYATVTIVALLRYKNDKGFYPENLQELISTGYVSKLPIDPWSDKPLIYKKTDEGFVLYSVGPNFKDDGGEVVRDYDGQPQMWGGEGDVVFWPVPEFEVKR